MLISMDNSGGSFDLLDDQQLLAYAIAKMQQAYDQADHYKRLSIQARARLELARAAKIRQRVLVLADQSQTPGK